MFFHWFRTFCLHHNDYFASSVYKIWDITQVVQTIKTDVPKFRFTTLGSNLANLLYPKNIHIVYNMQKEYRYVIQFYKIINNLFRNLSFVRQYLY